MAGKREKKKPRLKHKVCKPCWELKYCPYGPLVEYFPLHPEGLSQTAAKAMHRRARAELKRAHRELDVCWAVQFFLFSQPEQWAWVNQFRVDELTCNVFGHVCPVFFAAEPFTETKDERPTSRNVSREVMLKVVRRDGQICQICHQPVPDDQVEFDHVIPFSRGGPATAGNLRVVCRDCNRKKRDSLKEILYEQPDAREGA